MRFLPLKSSVLDIILILLWGMNFPSHAQNRVYPFVENGKIGYKDSLDQVQIDPQFDYIEEFEEGLTWTVVGTGKYDLLNHNLDHKELNFTGRFGLIDQDGNFIFKPVFSIILARDAKNAIVGNGIGYVHFENFPEEKNYVFEGDLGVVNTKGDTLVPLQYRSIQTLTSGSQTYWFAKNEDHNELYSSGHRFSFKEKIESIENFSEGLARIKTQTGFGFIDTTGQMTILPIYYRATHFKQGRAWVKKQDQYFYIDTKGKKLDSSSFYFDEVAPFSDGVALVRIFDEYGFINSDSTFFITPEFSEAGSFFNGITYVSTVDSFGYIHNDGRMDWVRRYEYDPILAEKIGKYQPVVLKVLKGIPCEYTDSSIFRISFDSLDLLQFISFQMEVMRWAPYLYYKYPQMLARVSAGEGTLSGRHEFNLSFLNPGSQPWEWFKREVLYVILKDDQLRSLTWDWLKPFYKKVFRSMPEKHQEIYREMVEYLVDYFEDYSKNEVEEFLLKNPDEFAYQHWDGSRSPYRKVSAMFERLIFVHQVIALEDVQYWVIKVQEEMKRW